MNNGFWLYEKEEGNVRNNSSFEEEQWCSVLLIFKDWKL